VSRRLIDLDTPDRFDPLAFGDRRFESCYLQAARGPRAVTVAIGCDQLASMVERMVTIIDELERRGLVAIDPAGAVAVDPGDQAAKPPAGPPHEDFVADSLSIAWDDDGGRLIVEARSISFDAGAGESAPARQQRATMAGPAPWDDEGIEEHPEDDPMGPDVLRVRLRPVMAQRFVRQATRISAANRRTCPICGAGLGLGRHQCPGPGRPPGRPLDG